MRDFSYMWDRRRGIEEHFSVFLVCSLLVHALLLSLSLGVIESEILLPNKDAPVVRLVVPTKLKVTIGPTNPELPGFERKPLMSVKTMEREKVRLKPRREDLSLPSRARPPKMDTSVKETVSSARLELLRPPDAGPHEIPRLARSPAHRPEPEKPRRTTVPHRQRLILQEVIDRENKVALYRPKDKTDLDKTLLKNPLPDKKPSFRLIHRPVVMRELEKPRRLSANRPGQAGELELARVRRREAKTPASKPAESTDVEHEFLDLPKPSEPRLALIDEDDAIRGGWTAYGLRLYRIYIRRKLHKSMYYPRVARRRDQRGFVTVRFRLDREGQVSEVVIHRSSMYPVLDRAAVHVVKRSAPFPRFPAEVKMEEMVFEVDIVFILGG